MQPIRTIAGVFIGSVFAALTPAAFTQPASQEGDLAPPTSDEAFEAGWVEPEGGRRYPYRLLPPPEGVPAPAEGWPLIVFLHGAGERGSDNIDQLHHFPRRMAEPATRDRLRCFVLAVQCPVAERWIDIDWSKAEPQAGSREPEPSMRAVVEAIRRIVAERPVDPSRITLTGLSMGGFGTWDLAARKPGWFAAIAPVCGGGDPERAGAYRDLPVWAWHDEGDPVVPVALSRTMVEAARAAGARVRYDEVSGHGHASWVPAYEADRVPTWLLAQRREKADPELAALAAARGGDGE
jgi:predicted peptidase